MDQIMSLPLGVSVTFFFGGGAKFINQSEHFFLTPGVVRFADVKVMLLLERIIHDHDHTAPSLRKPVGYREGLTKHQACAAFLHYLQILRRMSPAADFPAMEKELRSQFAYGYMDPDLLHNLEQKVPPGDVNDVAAFR